MSTILLCITTICALTLCLQLDFEDEPSDEEEDEESEADEENSDSDSSAEHFVDAMEKLDITHEVPVTLIPAQSS